MIDEKNLDWLKSKGYLRSGLIEFSDRLPAQYANITIGVGTYQYKANDAIRKYLIPESMFPFDEKNYYDKTKVTQQMIDLSAEFCKRFTFNWHWTDDPTEQLKKSPVSAVVRFANGEGILAPPGALNHCIMVYGEKSDHYEIDDNYIQQNKKYRKDYVYHFVGHSLTINNTNMNTKFIEDNDLRFVRNTNTGQFGRIMQGKLRVVTSTDRGTLMLLDNEHRKSGLSISNSEWETLPKQDF